MEWRWCYAVIALFVLANTDATASDRADFGSCNASRVTLSPSGNQAVIDSPLAFYLGGPPLTSSHEVLDRPGLPVPPAFLVRFDCEDRPGGACDPIPLAVNETAPWSQIAWSEESQYAAVILTTGGTVAGQSSNLVIIDGEDGRILGETGSLYRKLILTPGWTVDDPVVAVEAIRKLIISADAPASDIPASEIRLGMGQDADLTPTESAFLLLGDDLRPVSELEIGFSETRWHNHRLTLAPAHRSVNWAVSREPKKAVRLTRVNEERETEILSLSDEAVMPYLTVGFEGHVEFRYGPSAEPVLIHDDLRIQALHPDAEAIARRIEHVLANNPTWRLVQVSVSERLDRSALVLVRGSNGRRFILVSAYGPQLDIAPDCESNQNHADFVLDQARFATSGGTISVRRVRGWANAPPMRALVIEFPQSPSQSIMASRPPWVGSTSAPDFFMPDMPAFTSWSLDPPSQAEFWNGLASYCREVLTYVRDQYRDEYDVIGVAGSEIGGLVAATALFEGQCPADYVVVHRPALGLRSPYAGDAGGRFYRPGLGEHPIVTLLRERDPGLPQWPVRRIPAFISAWWPDSLIYPTRAVSLADAIGPLNPQARWSFDMLDQTAPLDYLPYERRDTEFDHYEARRSLAEAVLESYAPEMRR